MLIGITIVFWSLSLLFRHLISPVPGKRLKHLSLSLLSLVTGALIVCVELGLTGEIKHFSNSVAQFYLFAFFFFSFRPFVQTAAQRIFMVLMLATSTSILMVQFGANIALSEEARCASLIISENDLLASLREHR